MLSVHTPLFLLGTRLGVELLGHRECVCSAFTDAAGQLSQLHSPQELTDRNTMQSGLAKKNAQVHATKPWDKGRCSRLRGGGGVGRWGPYKALSVVAHGHPHEECKGVWEMLSKDFIDFCCCF